MTTIAEGVLQVETSSRDNCFVVDEGDGLTLVDVGWRKAPDAIAAALVGSGHGLADVRRVVVTHAHPDHVRGLAELVRRTGAQVLVHALDAPWLASGQVPRSGRAGLLGRVIDRVPLLHWEPVTADVTLADGDVVGSLRVVHTPGHSPGHVVVLHEPTGALLVGDAVFHRDGLALGPDALAAEPHARAESLRRLPREPDAVGFAHGSPLLGHDVATWTEWLASV